MIFVDTSVWVEALRSATGSAASHLRGLLDANEVALAAPVRIEILAGASNRDRPTLRRLLSALPLYFPAEATWTRIDEWLDRAGKAGERFGFAGLLIGALAAEHDAAVWSFDEDFRRMARLGLITIHRT